MMSRKRKTFDCVDMKVAAQREIVQSIDALAPDQEILRLRSDVEKGPLAAWWSGLPKDPGPEAAPTSDASRNEGSRGQ